MILTKTDEQRRQELADLNRASWEQPGEMSIEYRIAEKEADSERILTKFLDNVVSLRDDVSLLAVPNDKLIELLQKISELTLEVDSEARRRE